MIKQIETKLSVLKTKSQVVSPDFNCSQIVTDLKETLINIKHGYGLAGIQIQEPFNIAHYKFNGIDNVLINPKIISKEHKIIFNEGCLSFPKLVIPTSRYASIRFLNGFEQKEFSVDGIEAIIIQHEIDHMNGITIFDRKHKRIK